MQQLHGCDGMGKGPSLAKSGIELAFRLLPVYTASF